MLRHATTQLIVNAFKAFIIVFIIFTFLIIHPFLFQLFFLISGPSFTPFSETLFILFAHDPFHVEEGRQVFLYVKGACWRKPFSIDKSDPGRLLFKCGEKLCSFKMVFRANESGVFQLLEEHAHNCLAVHPTIKRLWDKEQVYEFSRPTPE